MKKPLIFVCSSIVLFSFNPEIVIAEKNNVNKGIIVKGEDISKLTDEELQYIPKNRRDGIFESEHPKGENAHAASINLASIYPDVNTYIQNMQPAKVEYQHKEFFPKFYYRNGKGAVEGVVAHETANENSTIIQEISYMSRNYNNAFVHAFVDHERVIEIHPLDYGAWGAGRFANERFVHVELARTENFDQFARSINNYANYIADILYDYHLDVIDAEVSGQGTLWSHNAVSKHLGATDHVDPHGYFARYGYSWDQFVSLVVSKYNKITRVRYRDTSKLGHLNSSKVHIYETPGELNNYKIAGSELIDAVYYIKREASIQKDRYYLISNEASATSGVIGWVRSSDLTIKDHIWKDSKKKTFYLKGTGKAYSRLWGGLKQVVYDDMEQYKDQTFEVNLTETVGEDTWYRGDLNGQTVWVHSSDLYAIDIKSTSKLGHFNSGAVQIYRTLGDSSTVISSRDYVDSVYYIKQQAEYNGSIYYLLSNEASATSGVIGWARSSDLTVKDHIWKDSKLKTYYIKGTGKAYSRLWGGMKQVVYSDLAPNTGEVFQVNLTETVGGDTWYRGDLNGQTVWLHSSDVNEAPVIEIKSTSKLGHFNSGLALIYKKFGDSTTAISSKDYVDAVYYIKQEAVYNGATYYLLSNEASATSGIIGWVKSSDLTVKDHIWKDSKLKTYYIKGTGKAYSRLWGGMKQLVYSDLAPNTGEIFLVNLTETVGGETWYRGNLNGQTVWLHSSDVNEAPVIEIKSTSKLGHFNSGSALIYKKLGDSTTAITSKDYVDAVYYIKQEAVYNGATYYLLSNEASATSGIIGWVRSSDLTVKDHIWRDSKRKTYYIKGTGKAYSRLWGGAKQVVYSNMAPYAGNVFQVNLTETVGGTTWFRGNLNGMIVWINEKDLQQSITLYTQYNLTLDEALSIQMKASPQTDKYKDEPAYVNSQYVDILQGGIIAGNRVNVRTSTSLKVSDNIFATLDYGEQFILLDDDIQGDSYNGSTRWYKIEYKNEILYVHSSLALLNFKIGRSKFTVNIYSSNSESSHVYKTAEKGALLTIIEEGQNWHKVSLGNWRNATKADVLYYLNPANFIYDEKQKFQFLDLSKPSGASADVLNKYLEGKGTLEGQGQAFIDASNINGISDLYLLSHALLETGHGFSDLAQGIEYNGVTVYNMFGIGAIDSNPIEGGAKTAYENGWTTPYKAIVGGAAFIGNKYIKAGQNTLYKMRWNPAAMESEKKATHQYATDIGWAYKQINVLYNLYQDLGIQYLNLDIPVYKN